MSATPKEYFQILRAGTQANYAALATKDERVLYFCTDTGKLYKGSVDFTNSIIKAASKPQTPVQGKVYVLADTGTVEFYDGTNWVVISYPLATSVSASSDDDHVASAKAVYDAIQAAISGDGVVNAVEASTTEGNISVTTDGTTSDVVVHGVVTTPSYEASSRTFTFPVSDGNDVVVELGKDIFIDPEGDNSYHPDTKEIWLTLNDGSATSDPTVIKIPADGLVNIISTEDTTSVDLTYNTSTGVMSAAVILKPNSQETGAEFTNSLQLANDGLYVDL
jgi:hypothetical protein